MNDYSYYYSYPTYSDGSDVAAGALSIGIILAIVFFSLLTIAVFYVVGALLMSQLFKKAGEPRWIAWVPVYNSWKFLELGGQQGFWAILAFIPVVNIVSAVFYFIAMYHIGLKLGKSGEFVILGIFLPLIWFLIVALDHSTWEAKKPKHKTPPSVKLA